MINLFDNKDILVALAPLYLGSIMVMFIVSRKWMQDTILLASVASSVFCLLAFSMGHIYLAIATILSSNTVLVVYSMLFRKRNFKGLK